MKQLLTISLMTLTAVFSLQAQSSSKKLLVRFPANNAVNVNPDTHLAIVFPDKPVLHNTGKIRIYDASTDQLVDVLDLAIPPGPRNTRTPYPYDSFIYNSYADTLYTVSKPDTSSSHVYQQNYIGGNTAADAYHFFPVLVDENKVTIFPHNNKLQYNGHYYVQIDAGVLALSNRVYYEITGKSGWLFHTKNTPPAASAQTLVVSADGNGDFNTVQAAIDFIPAGTTVPVTIDIKNGIYEEIVYFRGKNNIRFVGEDRNKTIIRYPNNGVFNTRLLSADPMLVTKYHTKRPVFAAHNANGIHIINLTLQSAGEKPAQAEALYLLGKEIIVGNTTIDGSGDALQASGTIYITDTEIKGYGDNVLGYGAIFFNHCDFVSTFGPHLWVRNTQANHGNALVNCTLRTIGDVETTIARAPNSNGKTYPYVEAVLINCSMEGIRPEGWGKTADTTENIHYWEYNSKDLNTGQPVDISKRHPASRQLTMEKDAAIIKNFSTPSFVLGGWSPVLAPLK